MEKQLCGEPLWEPLEKLVTCQTGLLRALEIRLGARTPQSENNNGVNINESISKDPHFIGQIMLDCLQETLPVSFELIIHFIENAFYLNLMSFFSCINFG